MGPYIRRLAVLVAGVCCGSLVQAQPPQGMIRGRIVAADTGLPIHDAVVRIQPEAHKVSVGPPDWFTGVPVDDDGSFHFTKVPAGRVTIAVSPGAASLQYLPATFPDSSKDGQQTFTLDAGQILDDVVIALVRGGAISGRVVNERGQPVALMSVTARERLPGGRFRPLSGLSSAVANARTDDHGQFRVFGLRPGEYVLSAQPSGLIGSRVNSASIPPIYYPSTTSLASAARLQVRAGEDVGPVELQIQHVRSNTIRGLLLDSDGTAVAGAPVSLQRRSPPPAESRTAAAAGMLRVAAATTGGDGSFELAQIPSGDYVLSAFRLTEARREFCRMPLTLTSDLDGMVVRLQGGANVQGHVIFEGQSIEGVSWLRIKPVPDVDADRAPSIQVKDDGSFVLEDLVGPTVIQIEGAKNWYVKSVQHNGRDITDGAVDFAASPGALTVTLTQRAGTLGGGVTTIDGRPAQATVILLSGSPALRHERASTTRFVPSRPDGTFRFEGLRSGRYLAIAIPMEAAPFADATPEILRAPGAAGERGHDWRHRDQERRSQDGDAALTAGGRGRWPRSTSPAGPKV